MNNNSNLLNTLNLPSDLKKLTDEQCNELCDEIRSLLIKTISENGGHLASNLGTVEITVALHRIFDSPEDKIVWDVGHQCYTHKILTGRLDKFSTIRKEGGLSGFPKPDESEHDSFISGHSSTSISVAYGIAEAMRIKGDRKHFTVAVIGDGALTGGLAYEGLNNAGKSRDNIIIILNDNAMSISKNVGALSKYLREIRTHEGYVKAKQHVERKLLKIPYIGIKIARLLKSIKDSMTKKFMHKDITMFENLGFVYLGPVDGHDIKALENAMRAAKTYHCPVLIHVNTVKGKGYAPAEENPGEYHGVSKFDIATGNPEVEVSESYSTVFGKELVELGLQDKRICAITAAMKYGTGLQFFAKKIPSRFYDVGIAEQHAVTFAAGLASQGLIPVFAVYSSFLQRSFDQMLHDVSIGGYHVVLGIDRSGVVGEDGETHQGMFDIGLITDVPHSSIYAPANYQELKLCLKKAIYDEKGLACVRYPKGKEDKFNSDDKFVTDTFKLWEHQNEILVICYGRVFCNVREVHESYQGSDNLFDFLKLTKIFPLSDKIINICKRYKTVIFFEEAYKYGGIAELTGDLLMQSGFKGKYKTVNVTGFLKQASVNSIIDRIGMSPDKIYEYIKNISEYEKTQNANKIYKIKNNKYARTRK